MHDCGGRGCCAVVQIWRNVVLFRRSNLKLQLTAVTDSRLFDSQTSLLPDDSPALALLSPSLALPRRRSAVIEGMRRSRDGDPSVAEHAAAKRDNDSEIAIWPIDLWTGCCAMGMVALARARRTEPDRGRVVADVPIGRMGEENTRVGDTSIGATVLGLLWFDSHDLLFFLFVSSLDLDARCCALSVPTTSTGMVAAAK